MVEHRGVEPPASTIHIIARDENGVKQKMKKIAFVRCAGSAAVRRHREQLEPRQCFLRGAKQRKAPRGSSKAAAMASTMAKAAFSAAAPLEQASEASPVTR